MKLKDLLESKSEFATFNDVKNILSELPEAISKFKKKIEKHLNVEDVQFTYTAKKTMVHKNTGDVEIEVSVKINSAGWLDIKAKGLIYIMPKKKTKDLNIKKIDFTIYDFEVVNTDLDKLEKRDVENISSVDSVMQTFTPIRYGDI